MRSTSARVRRLTTAKEVVKALGGVAAVKALTDVNVKAVYHWANDVGLFPARTYDCMKKALKRRGYTAPAALWNQIVAKKAA
jgi:hypothetical protein